MKEKKQDKSSSAFGRLMEYAGRFKALTYLSLILSALSSVLALLPFVCIWRIIREVLEVQPDFSRATGMGKLSKNLFIALIIALIMDIATPRSRRKPAPGGFRVSDSYLPLIWRSCCSIMRLTI